MDGSQPINPFLAGNYAPVRSEDDFELTVTGELPAGLNGALYRTGPNPQFNPNGPHHWFMRFNRPAALHLVARNAVRPESTRPSP